MQRAEEAGGARTDGLGKYMRTEAERASVIQRAAKRGAGKELRAQRAVAHTPVTGTERCARKAKVEKRAET